MAANCEIQLEVADDHFDNARTGKLAVDSEGQLRARLEEFVKPGTLVVISAPD